MATETKGSVRISLERPQDSDITSRGLRGVSSRRLSVLATIAVILWLPTWLVGYWGSLLGFETLGGMIGFGLGGWALSKLAPRRLFVYNPEWRAYVTQNVVTGKMIPYGPGAHPSHWWEQRNAEGNYSLEVQSAPFTAVVPAKPSRITIGGYYEYGIDLANIDRAIGRIKPEMAKGEISQFVVSSIINENKDEPSETLIDDIGRITDQINDRFKDDSTTDLVRQRYGFRTTSVVITTMTRPEDVQTTKEAIGEAEMLFSVMAKLAGLTDDGLKAALENGTISKADHQKLLTRAMAVSKNQTTIDVKVFEGLEGGQSDGQRNGRRNGRPSIKSNPRDAAVTGAIIGSMNQKGGPK